MKPILFNTEMVRAILDGRKTVTRRLVKPPALYAILEDENGECVGSYYKDEKTSYIYPTVDDCPYQPGDILYVRETFFEHKGHYYYKADGKHEALAKLGIAFKWSPSIHMPREAARIFLRVTNVKVERLQEITEEQARAEGAEPFTMTADVDKPDDEKRWQEMLPALSMFPALWDSTINKADRALYAWDSNPWCWVIEFERRKKPEREDNNG